MDRCVACGAELGVGRFCLNCGHRIGAPAPPRREPAAPAPQPSTVPATAPAAVGDPAADAPSDASGERGPDPGAPPAQAADPVVPPAQAADPVVPPAQAADPVAAAPGGPPAGPPGVVPDEPAGAPSRRPTWDPREDLLPYEEVDDLDGDLPVRGKAWIGWVAGAALLVGLAFLLLRVFGSVGDEVAADPDDGTTGSSVASRSGSDSSDGGAEPSRGVGKALELTRGATFEVPGTAPPTTDLDGTLVAYEPSQMGDGNPATAWRTAGDATGETITVTLREPAVVTRVGLVNGYAKRVAGVHWYPHNRRTIAVRWGFDDGSSLEQTFAERPRMQWLKVPPVETASVTITFTAVTPPGPGTLGRDYTAISEVSITGRRAG